MRVRMTRWAKAAAVVAGIGLVTLGYFLVFPPRMPTTVVETLSPGEWGFGSIPPGTAYYVQPQVSCVAGYGQSHRLGCLRVVTGIRYAGITTVPPPHLPPSAR